MNIKNASIQYHSSKGVFWRKSYFEKEGSIFLTVIICASEEFLSQELGKSLPEIMDKNINDTNIQKWFEERIINIENTERNAENKTAGNLIIDIYPQTNGMLDAAKSFLSNLD